MICARHVAWSTLAAAALAAAAPARALEITDFKSGLACMDTVLVEGSKGWICHATEEILVTDQGRCVYDGKEKLCTWYGFEFMYSDAGDGAALDCVTSYSKPVNEGNPEGVVAEETTSQEFTFELAGGRGRFFNPQYAVFRVVDPGFEPHVISTTCRHGGREVISFRFRVSYPEVAPEPATEEVSP